MFRDLQQQHVLTANHNIPIAQSRRVENNKRNFIEVACKFTQEFSQMAQ